VHADLGSDAALFVISVSHAGTIYTSLYVALTEKRDIPMVTADVRLIGRMSGDAALAKCMIWGGIWRPGKQARSVRLGQIKFGMRWN
jgi:hypothetical protein